MSYGRFWARFGGVFLDGLVINFAMLPALLVVGFLGRELIKVTATCEEFVRGQFIYRECSPVAGVFWTVVGVQVLSQFGIWWLLVPRRMANRGATIGMNAAGLRIVTAKGHMRPSVGQAFARAALALFVPIVVMAPIGLIIYFGLDLPERINDGRGVFDDVETPWLWVSLFALAYFAIFIPYLWNLVDRRFQTLYDKIVGTIVIEK